MINFTCFLLFNNHSQFTYIIIKKKYQKREHYVFKKCQIFTWKNRFEPLALYISGAEGIPQDKNKASKLFLTACNKGNIFACMNLSRMYKTGDGIEKSEEKATYYKSKAKEIRDDHRKKPNLGLQQYV